MTEQSQQETNEGTQEAETQDPEDATTETDASFDDEAEQKVSSAAAVSEEAEGGDRSERGDTGWEEAEDDDVTADAQTEESDTDDSSADGESMDAEASPDEEFELDEFVEDWVEELLSKMNYELDVEFEERDDQHHVTLSGIDADTLLGKGQMSPRLIESIETLLSATVARRWHTEQLFVDIDGFREEREKRLNNLAEELRSLATRMNKKITIAGVDRYERKLIHEALRDDDAVETDSVGGGVFRKIQVVPN